MQRSDDLRLGSYCENLFDVFRRETDIGKQAGKVLNVATYGAVLWLADTERIVSQRLIKLHHLHSWILRSRYTKRTSILRPSTSTETRSARASRNISLSTLAAAVSGRARG